MFELHVLLLDIQTHTNTNTHLCVHGHMHVCEHVFFGQYHSSQVLLAVYPSAASLWKQMSEDKRQGRFTKERDSYITYISLLDQSQQHLS